MEPLCLHWSHLQDAICVKGHVRTYITETSRYAAIVVIEPNRCAGIIYAKPSRCADIVEAKSAKIGLHCILWTQKKLHHVFKVHFGMKYY